MDLFDMDPQLSESLPTALAWTFREARLLQVAVRLRLFTALNEKPRSAAELAAELATDSEMTERLLVALSAYGLVIHDNGAWRNRLAASICLVEGQPMYQGDAIEMAGRMWSLYSDLERIVRSGRTTKSYRQWKERYGARDEQWVKARQAMAMAGQAQRLARIVGALAGRRTLLDVGGAPGLFSIALCQRFPILRATVLDSAEALALTEPLVLQFGLADRIALKEGGWSDSSLGKSEYDAILLTHILSSTEAQAQEELIKCYQALKGGGLLIAQTYLLDNDLNGGQSAALFNVTENATTLDEMRALLAEAGFERITIQHRDVQGSDILTAYKPVDADPEPEDRLFERISPEQEIFALMELEEGDLMDVLASHRQAWERLVRNN